jgi:hypothetical protein
MERKIKELKQRPRRNIFLVHYQLRKGNFTLIDRGNIGFLQLRLLHLSNRVLQFSNEE